MNHLTDEQLSAYLDGAYKGRDADEFGRHLARCQPCSEALAELAAQDEALKPAITHDPGEAYFERFAGRVEDRIRAAGAPGASTAPGPGFDLGRFFRSPRALAWAGGVAVVVVGGGLALMTGREVIPPDLRHRDRAAQVERAAPGGTGPAAPTDLRQESPTGGIPPAEDAIPPAPSVDEGAATPGSAEAEAPVVTAEHGSEAKVRADAPAPAPSAEARQAAPRRAVEVRRNEAGEEVPMRPPAATPAAPAPSAAPVTGEDGTSRVRKKMTAGPLDAAKPSAPRPTSGATGAREEPAAPDRSFAPAPTEESRPSARVGTLQAPDAQNERPLCGDVRDADGRPIAGAQVVLADLGRTATTDARGRFCMSAPPGEHPLSVMAVGYRESRQVVRVTGGQTEAPVTLAAVPVLDGKGDAPAKRTPAGPAKSALPTEPIGPPATWPPLDARDVYSTLSDTLQRMVREARRLEADAAARRSASHYDFAAGAWGRLLPRLAGGPLEIETRRHVAENRFRAWELSPGSRRAQAAVEALTSFLTRAPAGPERDQAVRWLDRVGP